MRFRIAQVLIGFWLMAVIPLWLLGMGFAGDIVFVPDTAFRTLDGTLFLLAMYAPPVISALLLMAHFRSEQAR
jgi:hypothetical protein